MTDVHTLMGQYLHINHVNILMRGDAPVPESAPLTRIRSPFWSVSCDWTAQPVALLIKYKYKYKFCLNITDHEVECMTDHGATMEEKGSSTRWSICNFEPINRILTHMDRKGDN